MISIETTVTKTIMISIETTVTKNYHDINRNHCHIKALTIEQMFPGIEDS